MVRESAQGEARTFSGAALVIEDDALIALSLQDMLEEIGFFPVHIAHTVEDAEKCAGTRYAFAVVDIKIIDGESLKAASRLRANGTPFVFTSGYAESTHLPTTFADVPYLTKPFEEGDLRAVLTALIEKAPKP
jgi:DNA-binding response OmpR family regulator